MQHAGNELGLLLVSIELIFSESLKRSSDMVQVLLVCSAKNEYVLNVNVYTDSQLMFEQVVHDVREGGRSIAVTLLHDSSPVGAIWGRKCSTLSWGGLTRMVW